MKENHTQKQYYNLLFVILLTAAFLFVMLMSYGEGYEKFADNFFQKKFLIENFNHLRIKVGDRVFPNVLIGKNGWMEFTGEGNLDDYQNKFHFSPEDLQNISRTIETCHQYALDHNIIFLIVVAPNKASIYPDMLPDQIRPVSDLSRFDQLNNYLRMHNVPELLDLRPALRNARRQHDVYYKLGTHWNDYGAYIAYETIMNTLAQNNPAFTPYSPAFFQFHTISPNGRYVADRGVAGMIQLNYLDSEPALFSTRNFEDVVYKIDFSDPRADYHRISWIPNSDLPTLLMFHDSFGNLGLNDFLRLNFSKVTYIHRASSPLYLNQEVIAQFAPDVMIYEVVERNLSSIQYHLSGCAQE